MAPDLISELALIDMSRMERAILGRMETMAETHRYTFDMELRTIIHVTAANAKEAREMVHNLLENHEANFGAWPDGEPVVSPVRWTMREIIEQDGKPIRNGDAT